MKPLARSFASLAALLLPLLFASQIVAQDTFKPLISDTTVAIGHLDFSKLEIDGLKKQLADCGEQFITGLGFDERSKTATLRELNVELEKLDKIVRPTFETISNELGIREVAVFVDMDLIPHEIAAVVAIPWKDDSPQKRETLKNVLQLPDRLDKIFVSVPGFLLVGMTQFPGDRNAEIAEWASNLKPAAADAKIYEALKECGDDELKIAAVMPEQVRAMMQPHGNPQRGGRFSSVCRPKIRVGCHVAWVGCDKR